MNELLRTLADGLKRSSLASKLTAGLVALAVVLAVGVSAFVSNRPHFSVLLSGLDDNESAAAMRALAEAGIGFEASQPPGPFVVYVDEDERQAALAAIYQAGAMVPLQKGIPSGDGGMESVFMSSGERQQMSQKRLWGEMEGILEALDFVAQAKVQTSTSTPSPFAGHQARRTAAVQIQVKDLAPISPEQAQTVVMLVSRGLEILPQDIALSDQTGRLLAGGPEEEAGSQEVGDWLEHKERYDVNLAAKANRVLSDILGPSRARVEVDSLWSFELSTTESDTVSKGAIVTETKNTTETPLGSNGAGIVGSSANVDFGVENAAVADATLTGEEPVAAAPAVSTSSEEKTEFNPSRSRKEVVNHAPVLKRLSVAMFLDDSIAPEAVQDLEDAVKAAVGYDAELRTDNMKTVRLPFAEPPPPEAVATGEPSAETPAEPAAEEDATDEPSPLMRMLLRRGVEVLTALAFIVLLLSSLRSARKSEAAAAAASAAGEGESVDPELLAQAQVQELLSSDPKRVGEILTQWAREADKAGSAR